MRILHFLILGTGLIVLVSGQAKAGSLTVQEDLVQDAGSFNADGTVLLGDNAYQLQGGTLDLAGGLINRQPNLDALIVRAGGTVVGSGSINGHVRNNGTIYIGGRDLVGSIAIIGNFTQSGNAHLHADISSSVDNQYDVLHISGQANLGGEFHVHLLNYNPVANDLFRLIRSTQLNNTFDGIPLPDLGANRQWQNPIYTNTEFQLRVI